MTHGSPPASAEAIFAAGNALAASGDYLGALACYAQVRAMRPTDPMVHHNIGAALTRLRRLEEAVASYQRAIEINPALHATINNLGNALRGLGRFEDAHNAYRAAILLAPEKGAYYRNVVQSKRLSIDDPLLLAMEQLVEAVVPLPLTDRIHLHFALGQALEDIGENERSFHHLLAGNALQRGHVTYDEAVTLGLFKRVSAVFTQELMRDRQGCGDPSPTPVFIIGMPRSGSTLIEQILASHPGVLGVGERADFTQAVAQLVTRSGGVRSDLEAITSISADGLAQLGADYLRRLEIAAGGTGAWQRITDKYPFNFVHVGLIHMALPNARFIHSCRGPVETCLSCFSRLFDDVPFSYDLGELGRYYSAYHALMEHWHRVLPTGVMIDVRYEDLVANFEGETRRMLAHCGLEWHESCLSFHETTRIVVTESAAQVRRPIYRTSVERWRPALELLQPLLDGLGIGGLPSRALGVAH
jgi:tetratricopeptide (TPR) repeat protein